MRTRYWKHAAIVAVLGLGATGTIVPSLRPALAQGVTRSDINGTWVSRSGDSYTFRSNGTYTFSTGDRTSGNVSHSGTWGLQHNGLQLRLRANRRVVLEGRRRRTLSAGKTFLMTINFKDYDARELYIGGKLFKG